jgi:hypothetical protein
MFEGKPLEGATVKITKWSSTEELTIIEGATDKTGHYRVALKEAGNYWLKVDHLGLNAAYFCFHSRPSSGLFAKRSFKLDFDRYEISLRRLSGLIRELRPGPEGTPYLMRFAKPVAASIPGAKLRAIEVFSRRVWETQSGSNGQFAFPDLPPGSFVFVASGGVTSRPYDETRQLLRVESNALPTEIVLTNSTFLENGCGSRMLRIDRVSRQVDVP